MKRRCRRRRCCRARWRGRWPRRAAGARAAPPTRRARCCGSPSAIAETGFDPAQHLRPVLAHRSRAHIFEALYELRPPGAAGQDARRSRRRACPRCRPTSATWTVAAQAAASTSPTTRPSGARGASWWRRTTSTRSSAIVRPAQEEPGKLDIARDRSILGLGELRAGSAQGQEAVRLRPRRSKACARSTATRSQFKLRRAAPALPRTVRRRRPARRAWRARWSSSTATGIGEHPVGTGPFRLSEWRRARASCSSATRTTARCATTPSRPADDAEAPGDRSQRFKGRRLPMVDRGRDRRSSRSRSRAGWRS